MDTFSLFLVGVMLAIALDVLFLYKVYESSKYVKFHSEYTLKNHRTWVDRFLFAIVVTVLLIKGMASTKYGSVSEIHLLDTFLGKVHALFDLIFSGSVITMRWFQTGLKNPKVHKRLFRIVVISFSAILITGGWLTVRMVG